MVAKVKPRFVVPKNLASGETAYYWEVPTYHRDLGCTIPNEPLGTDYVTACGDDGKGGRAAALNGLFESGTPSARAVRRRPPGWRASAQSLGCSGNTSPQTIARSASPSAPGRITRKWPT